MNPLNTIPVIVLTGFLGSGKTTLLNHFLAKGPRTAVIINEFGNIPVDPSLIETQGMPLMTLAGGCLCCQIKGTLPPTLRNLWMTWQKAETKPFDRLIIETSGIASPEPILDTLLRDRWLSTRYRLQRVIATLAIPSAIEQMNRFAEVRAQVAWADVLVLTHNDLANADQIKALDTHLQTIAPATPLYRTTHERCDVDALLAGSLQKMRKRPDSESPKQHDFRSISLHLEQPIPWTRLQSILQGILADHAKDLLRIKGVVYLSGQDQPVVIQAAAGRLYPPLPLPPRASDDRRGRLVFIATANPESLADEIVMAIGSSIGKEAVRLH